MAAKVAGTLPPPPADLAARELPLTRVRGPLYRVHQAKYSAIFFGKSGRFRFDDPLNQYGVLYASLKPDAAFAEALLRPIERMLIPESALTERALSLIRLSPVRCVNLTGQGLRRLSCDNRIADELPYETSRLWSRALFEHPAEPAGIIYRSRHNPQLTCVALFSRVEKATVLEKTTPLLDRSLRDWTAKQLRRYQIALYTTP